MVALANELINLKVLAVDSPAKFRLMSDVLPLDEGRRLSFLQNLAIYARLGLELGDDRVLEVYDMETDERIASVAYSVVTLSPGYIL
jgi:hypothetical protein